MVKYMQNNQILQMPLHRTHLLSKSLSTTTTATSQTTKSLKWRTHIKQNLLVQQITSILLQRHNWPQLLHPFHLSSKLTPPLFHQILTNTQTHPQISLDFFNWAVKNTIFKPDLKSHCTLTRILIQSGLTQPAKPILDSLIRERPPSQIVQSLIIPKAAAFASKSLMFDSVIDCYCKKGSYFQALELVQKTKFFFKRNGIMDYFLQYVTVHSCNMLLNVLHEKNEIRMALCFYGFMLRSGLFANQATWDLVARILRKDGRIESVVRIIEMGVYDSLIYNVVIECYCQRGDFEAALKLLDDMCKRKLKQGFNTYVSILDGACRYGNCEVISVAMYSMVEKGYVSKVLTNYDSIIQKLSNMGKIYAADMFLKRALDEKIILGDDTYGCVLRALSKAGQAKDAIGIYRVMEQNGIQVKDSCYGAFTEVLCKEYPSAEISSLLLDMISRGYCPSSLELSEYVTSQCDNERWEEAEELVNFSLEKSLFPVASCFCSLVKHYCKIKRIDLAIDLHDKMAEKERTLDLSTYNVLLSRLTRRRRLQDAERVFDYMRKKDVLNSESFSIMITALCHESELRKAMKLHDEMLRLGLKPDGKVYKRLISRFK